MSNRVLRTLSIDADLGASSRSIFQNCKAEIRPDESACIFAFASGELDRSTVAYDLERQFGGQCPVVIGCTTAGEIGVDGYRERSVSLISFPKEHFEAETVLFNVEEVDWTQVAAAVEKARANQKRRGPSGRTFAVLVIDGLSNREESVAAALGEYLQEIPLVGGSSGDNGQFIAAPLFFKGKVETGVASLTLLTTSLPFEVFRAQHFQASSTKVVVTASNPRTRTVYEIDGEPAVQRYAKIVGVAPSNLNSTLIAEHPLMLRVNDDYFVRSIMKANDDGSLTLACAIEDGLVLTVGNRSGFADELERFLSSLDQKLGAVSSILAFECIFRKVEVNALAPADRERVMNLYSKFGCVGFHTYGEQTGALHVNQTLTGVAFGR